MRTAEIFGFGLVFSLCLSACEGTSVLGTSNHPATPENQDGGAGTGGSTGTGAGGGAGARDGGAGTGGSTGTGAGGSGGVACETDEQCPIPDCHRCSDGTEVCGGWDCVEGTCSQWVAECPIPTRCETVEQCPIVDAECALCGDGTQACPRYECVPYPGTPGASRCVLSQPECPTVPCTTTTQCATLPNLPICRSCPDGSSVCAHPVCQNDACAFLWPACGAELCTGKACGEQCFPPCNDIGGAPGLCVPYYCHTDGACISTLIPPVCN
jgi:hypothetical protein